MANCMLTQKDHTAYCYPFFFKKKKSPLQHVSLNVEADVVYQIASTITVLKKTDSEALGECLSGSES